MIITTLKQLKKYTNSGLAKYLVLIEPQTEEEQNKIDLYFKKTTIDKPKQGRILYIEPTGKQTSNNNNLYYAEIQHGYGYAVADDVTNSL